MVSILPKPFVADAVRPHQQIRLTEPDLVSPAGKYPTQER
jgi:hypothetical protein